MDGGSGRFFHFHKRNKIPSLSFREKNCKILQSGKKQFQEFLFSFFSSEVLLLDVINSSWVLK